MHDKTRGLNVIKIRFVKKSQTANSKNLDLPGVGRRSTVYKVPKTRYNVPTKLPLESVRESPLLPSSIGVQHSTLARSKSRDTRDETKKPADSDH